MRIVAGELRGRLFEAPPGLDTRPTTDKVREAVDAGYRKVKIKIKPGAKISFTQQRVNDEVWLMDIYPAREQPIEGIDSHWLLSQIENPRKKWVSREELINKIIEAAPRVLVTMGAGDIGQQSQPIQNALSHAS